MARQFESGFNLVERCRRELPTLAAYLPNDCSLRAALSEVSDAACRVEALLRLANGRPAASVPVNRDA
jgi:hypothetical protein